MMNGNTAPYTLSNIEKMSFQNGNLSINLVSSSPIQFSVDSISSIHFSNGSISQSRSAIRESLRVYPNPVSDLLTVEFNASSRGNSVIDIISMDGRILMTQQIASGENRTEINVSSLSQGMYICRIRGNNNSIQFTKR